MSLPGALRRIGAIFRGGVPLGGVTAARRWLAIFAFCFCTSAHGLDGRQLAVVVDANESLSVRVGRYYRQAHGLPENHLISVRISRAAREVDMDEFQSFKREIDSRLPDDIQGVLFAWTQPYKVACLSFTSAYSIAYDTALCSNTCAPTPPSPSFNAASKRPWSHYGLRPSMLLPAENFSDAKMLIDRGVQAIGNRPDNAAAYLLVTPDKARSNRAITFPVSGKIDRPPLSINTLLSRRVQPQDAENRMSCGVGGLTGAIPLALPDRVTRLMRLLRRHILCGLSRPRRVLSVLFGIGPVDLNLLQTFLVMGVASFIALLIVRRLAWQTDITGHASAWAFAAATGILISIFVTMVSGIFFPALDFWRVPGPLVLNFADDKRVVNLANLIGYLAVGLALIAAIFGWRHYHKSRRNGSAEGR